MEGFIIDGKLVKPHFGRIYNYKEDPRLKLKPVEDMRSRLTRWIRSIGLHTTKGIAGDVKPGFGPDTNLEVRIAKLWANDRRHAGAHLSVDTDGSIGCHADLLQDATYHAPPLNEVSIGIEIYQEADGSMYEGQLGALCHLVDWLTAWFGIQRQMPTVDDARVIPRAEAGGSNLVGIFGHRHVGERGPGDPGDAPFEVLAGWGGYKQFNFYSGEDIVWWKNMQTQHLLKADGVPGPITCDALRAGGFKHGLHDWTANQR